MTKFKRAAMKSGINGEPLWVLVVELIAIGVMLALIFGLFK